MSTARIALSVGIWLIALCVSLPAQAHDRPDAAESGPRCEAEKVKEASRYHACLMNARFRAIIVGRNPERAMARCDARFEAKWPRIERRGGELCPSTGDEDFIQSLLAEQVDDVTTLLSGGTLPPVQAFPATGQTTCWDRSAFVIECEGTGHDGEIQAGAPLAYQDNGDGTITDLNTGLMWEKLSRDGSIHDWNNTYPWDDAFAVKVALLNGGSGFAGHTDWRVPNAKELMGILDFQRDFPAVSLAFDTDCVPACTVLTCSCTTRGSYWSSSTRSFIPFTAWKVNFGIASLSASAKVSSTFVRAVRGP